MIVNKREAKSEKNSTNAEGTSYFASLAILTGPFGFQFSCLRLVLKIHDVTYGCK